MNGLDCKVARLSLDAALDGEIDAKHRPALEAHLLACPGCRQALDGKRAIAERVKTGAERFTAPEEFKARLRAALPPDTQPQPQAHRASPWIARARAGSWAGAALALAASIVLFLASPSPQDTLTRELVGAHVRSLMAGHLTDVESSDRHTVKPWFNGRLDLSPPVPDLADQGFPLAGGRLDYIEERPAAALVYRHRQHLLNLFVWPEPKGDEHGLVRSQRNGYSILAWNQAGIAYALVSDLNPAEMEEFQRLWIARASGTTPPK